MALLLVHVLFVGIVGVLGEIKTHDFEMKSLDSKLMPSHGLVVVDEHLSRIECAIWCGNKMNCQTFFYNPNNGSCFLYKYPLFNNTPIDIETGVEIFEMKGCPYPGFVLFREAGVCLRVFTTTSLTFSYASSVCSQEGGELVSVNTNQKIDALAFHLIDSYGLNSKVAIGLKRSSGSWK